MTTVGPLYDVLIVGAGPVGLSLALALGRAGKSVLVLEKEKGLSQHSRAPAIWPRTQEVLSGLGVIERFHREGTVLPEIRIWDADRDRPLLSLPLRELENETSFPYFLILPQDRTERILYEALSREATAVAKFGVQVTGLDQTASGVRVHCSDRGNAVIYEARFAAGCDGAHSTVRPILNFSFPGMTYSVMAALADVRLGEERDYPFPRISDQKTLAIGVRIEKHLWRLILPFSPQSGTALDQRIEQSVRSLFAQNAYSVIWKSEFHLHRRISSGFVKNRVVLAGDAAHLNSPVGGQGMNAGIQDSEILARTLIQALAENNPVLLEFYEKNRMNAVRRGVNPFTNKLTQLLLFQGGRYVKLLFLVANGVFRVPLLRKAFLRRLAMVR
ncbi:MAG TPA: FAD-dependent oxidoreductase [bacterium]|nr:FAD-dependent oxidoreductase [bacterium]